MMGTDKYFKDKVRRCLEFLFGSSLHPGERDPDEIVQTNMLS